MLEVASQIIICLILAALLGWIIGYLMGKATCLNNEDSLIAKENTHPLPIKNKVVGTKPKLLTKAREGGADQLQLIKGIGPILEDLLNQTGIYHFDQIANLSHEETLWLDNSMAFPGRIGREEWISQAKDLAQGKETEFSKRVESGEVSITK